MVADWKREEEALIQSNSAHFSVSGFCAVCEESVDFEVVTENGRHEPNWREQMACPHCRMSNRVRAALNLAVNSGMGRDSRIYITEQFGAVYRWLRGHYNHVLGSEYILPGKSSGLQRLGINHQDVQALSLKTGSVDYLLSFDVLEHVPDPLAAFASFYRVLAPGGRLVMTVPFTIDKYDTTVRAVMRSDGVIEHFLPIEIHGNPLDPLNGSLCFRHFGWDALEQLGQIGFVEASVFAYHDARLGHLGGVQSLISAVKPGP